MDLQGSIHRLPQGIGDMVLRHRYLGPKIHLVFDFIGGMEHHQFRRIELQRALGHHPLNALLLCKNGSVRVTLLCTIDEHFQGLFNLTDPTHAVGKSSWPKPDLAQLMTTALLTQHIFLRDTDVVVPQFRMATATAHGLDVADDLKPWCIGWHNERAVSRLRNLSVWIRFRNDDGEISPMSAGGKPLVPVNNPFIAVLSRGRLDLRGVRPRHLWLRHRKTRTSGTLTQRT